MDPRVFPLGEVVNSDLVSWRALAKRAAEPNPFFEPEFLLPHARAMGQVEAVELLTLVDAGGEWRACVPLYRPSRWHRIPIRGVAPWRGHEHYGLLGTPLIDREEPAATVEELLAAIEGMTPRPGCSVLDWLSEPAAGGVASTVRDSSPHPLEFERFERALVRRRPEGGYEELTLSSKKRRELRRQRRKLGEELGGEPETIDRGGDPTAPADFIALEQRSGGASHKQQLIGDDPDHRKFFEEVCAGFSSAGRLQILELRCGGVTVAAKCNLRAGDTVFMLKIAYDARFSSLSPGILLELDTLKFFHERTDAEIMDSCATDGNRMINGLLPDRRTIVSYAFSRRGLGGRAALAGVAGARYLRDRKAERARKEKEIAKAA